MPRRFAIENDAGEKWDLNGDQGIFLNDPSGLGIQEDLLTSDLSYGFFRDLKNKKIPAEPIAGDLLFLPGDPYSVYRNFISFVFRSNKLKLMYRPFGNDIYYVNGRFEYLQKAELEKTGVLSVPFNFTPFSPWYQQKSLDLTMREHAENDMTYSFTYSNDLVYGSSLTGSYEVEINPFGHIAAAVTFSYTGSMENPKLTLIGANSETEYGSCEVIKSGLDGLRYSSLYDDCYVTDASGNDLLNYVSPDHSPYFRVPSNETCILRLSAASTLSDSANVSVFYYYRSV